MRRRGSLLFFVAVLLLPSVVFAGFVDNHDGTVTDSVTGLMWQQGDAQNDAGERTWEQALAYCEGLSLAEKPTGGCRTFVNCIH